MGRRKLIETYYTDLNNMADFLGKLVSSYRLLIGGAEEFNKIALAKKSEVKEALRRADDLGEIIDNVIESLEKLSFGYLDYCSLKSEIIKCKMTSENIETEIDDDLKFENFPKKD
ncbi:hypothetical protein [Candidatus Clostridium stratigraminis]|uniref:Uncharacterized protein n=1 Tax=Candidatus Clostridium stratigraminis TaxID=3381661 RepID=A0ABW8T5Y7_9CLOT